MQYVTSVLFLYNNHFKYFNLLQINYHLKIRMLKFYLVLILY